MTGTAPADVRSVSIIIPVYNEEPSLATLGENLLALAKRLVPRFRVHLLFVNDGSVDGTAALLPGVIPPGVSYDIYSHDRNRGVGAAFRTGFRHAVADVVCTIDADCSYGPAHLAGMIELVLSGAAGVVVASPYHPAGGVEGVQPWRLLLSRQCSRLYRVVTPLKLYTYTSIFRAYAGTFAAQARFPSDGFVSAVELLLCAHELGYRVVEAPLTLRRRSAGVSKMRVVRTARTHARLMLRLLAATIGRRVPPLRRQRQRAQYRQEDPLAHAASTTHPSPRRSL